MIFHEIHDLQIVKHTENHICRYDRACCQQLVYWLDQTVDLRWLYTGTSAVTGRFCPYDVELPTFPWSILSKSSYFTTCSYCSIAYCRSLRWQILRRRDPAKLASSHSTLLWFSRCRRHSYTRKHLRYIQNRQRMFFFFCPSMNNIWRWKIHYLSNNSVYASLEMLRKLRC